ncbi:hypothetical protein FBU30_002517, partial [Linnemannia zychae]
RNTTCRCGHVCQVSDEPQSVLEYDSNQGSEKESASTKEMLTPADLNDDQSYHHNHDHISSEEKDDETESDEERESLPKVLSNSGSALGHLDVARITMPSLGSDTSPGKADMPPTASNTADYNYFSNYEFPNGDIVETIQRLPSDQTFRAKSSGWTLLPLQSFKAIVKKNNSVKVRPHAGILKAQSSTFQSLFSLKKKKKDYNIDSDAEEQVDIAEKICFGVYKCPKCEFSERPRFPKGAKTRDSIPRPPVVKCTTHLIDLVWQRCSASAVVIHYYDRMITEIHHRGVHNHPKPPPMRADILSWRELEARVKSAPNDTAGKIMIGSRTQKPSREIHVAFANVDRLNKDVRTISN